MPVFIVRTEAIKWLCYATDTKEEAEQIALDTVNSRTIDWADGLITVDASPCGASEEEEIKTRQMTDAWKKQMQQMSLGEGLCQCSRSYLEGPKAHFHSLRLILRKRRHTSA
jgi:hypothetical protein